MGDYENRLLLERAKKAAAEGKWEDARASYEELMRALPEDVPNAYALANVYLRLGRNDAAISTLQWVAGRFAASGDLLRAIAALQGILKVDPKHQQTQQLLAELYAKRKASASTATPTDVANARAASVAPMGGQPAPRPTEGGQWNTPSPVGQAGSAALAKAKAEPEPEPLEISDADILPLIPGEPVRRLKGTGEAPQGFPNAIPLRYANVPLFSAFTTRTFVKVLEHVRVHRLEPETLIIKEGEKGNAIFAVADGVVRVTKEVAGQVLELATLPSGSFFGEMAMLTGAPRRASVWTVGEAEILEIPKPILDAVAAEAPTMAETLRRFFRERLLQTALATGALFRGLDPASRDKLVHRFRTMEAREGATVLEEGKPADGLYVIVDGVLQVHKSDTTGKRRALAVLRGGDFFGEMSLLYGGNAAATVSVSETATLLKLARNVCEEVLRERPEMVETIRQIAEARRKANDQAILAAKGKPTEGSSPA